MTPLVLFRAIAGPPIVLGLAVFTAAGTTQYWQAWAYLGLWVVGYGAVMGFFAVHSPAIVARRVGAVREERSTVQKVISVAIQLALLGIFAVPGLDRRLGWSQVPTAAVLAGDVLLVASFGVLFLVFRHNAFAAATVRVEREQAVVSSGPYAVVRHPMYAGGLMLVFGTAPALGSWWGWLGLAVLVPVILARLLEEERFLRANLDGYEAYCQRVRWRLVPGLY